MLSETDFEMKYPAHIRFPQACTLLRHAPPKHTPMHRHRTPPLVGRSAYLYFKGMGRNVIQSNELRDALLQSVKLSTSESSTLP